MASRRDFLALLLTPLLGKILPWPKPQPAPLFAPRYYGDGPWTFVVSDSYIYEFGFTGFKPAEDGAYISGQIQALARPPRVVRQLYGVGG